MPVGRQTPAGTHLEDGYQVLLTFSEDPAFALWEKAVTPPGVDGGDPIEQTTQHNTLWRTFAARSLRTLTPINMRAAWNPASYDSVVAMINVNQLMTAHMPDGSRIDFWGYLRSFTPDEMSEGTQPEAVCVIQPTNRDNSGLEVGPNYISPTGTANQ